MKRHFFIKKSCTILEDSRANTGMNPILQLRYGDGVSRVLFELDIDKIRETVKDDGFGPRKSIEYTVNMKNCASLVKSYFSETLAGPFASEMERTSSFDLILFKLPRKFDQGTGSSMGKDAWYDVKTSFSTYGCNWYEARKNNEWKPEEGIDTGIEGMDDGVYSKEYLKEQYDLFKNGEESIIVASQHFDFGTEDVMMDITDAMNAIIDDEFGYAGFGMAFDPYLEELSTEKTQYTGFFSDYTNSAYRPYLEISQKAPVMDDRFFFNPKKENKLFIFIGDEDGNGKLDTLPKCTIEGKEYKTASAGNGAYFAVIPPDSVNYGEDTIHYDEWSEIVLNGVRMDDIEMSFVEKSPNAFTRIGERNGRKENYVPVVEGINDNQDLEPGNAIEVPVDFIKEYSGSERNLYRTAEYKIGIREDENDNVLFDYSPLEVMGDRNSFMIYTDDFAPGRYYVDIKVSEGRQVKVYRNVVHFRIVGDSSERIM